MDEHGQPQYKIKYHRKKICRGETSDETYCLIVGRLEVSIIDYYISLFPPDKREGRFFKRIDWADKKTHKNMVVNNQSVGINSLRKYPMLAAELLKLENPQRYTGHCWRRSTASALARKNFGLSNIKLVTGHRSDNVVQEYIDNSSAQKLYAAKALATKRSRIESTESEDICVPQPDLFESAFEKRSRVGSDTESKSPPDVFKRQVLPNYPHKKRNEEHSLPSTGAHQNLNFVFNLK